MSSSRVIPSTFSPFAKLSSAIATLSLPFSDTTDRASRHLLDGNHPKSAKAEGSLTATPTGGAGTKVGLSDPVVLSGNAIAQRIKATLGITGSECNDCWAKLYCSGGCAANAFHATGSIRGVYEAGCELFRKRIECAIMMKVAEDSANS